VILVRDGAVIPQIDQTVQHTGEIDWTKLTLVRYGSSQGIVKVPLFIPGNADLINVSLTQKGNKLSVAVDSTNAKLTIGVKSF